MTPLPRRRQAGPYSGLDTAGRLHTVTETGGSNPSTFTYSYDARGNRLTAAVAVTGGANPSSQTLTYNAANQLSTTGYSYDGAGNLTAAPGATYTYNGAQQMTQAVTGSTTSTYTYAGTSQNQVLSETFSGITYTLTYGRPGPNGQPTLEQYRAGGGQAYLFSDPKTGQPIMLTSSSDQDCLYVMDGTGNPPSVTTPTGQRTSPPAAPATAPGKTPTSSKAASRAPPGGKAGASAGLTCTVADGGGLTGGANVSSSGASYYGGIAAGAGAGCGVGASYAYTF